MQHGVERSGISFHKGPVSNGFPFLQHHTAKAGGLDSEVPIIVVSDLYIIQIVPLFVLFVLKPQCRSLFPLVCVDLKGQL